jgi:hypothetical protein
LPFDPSPLLAGERSRQLRVESDSRARERAQELSFAAHNVTHIVVVLERRKMKAADNRMDFRNP